MHNDEAQTQNQFLKSVNSANKSTFVAWNFYSHVNHSPDTYVGWRYFSGIELSSTASTELSTKQTDFLHIRKKQIQVSCNKKSP